MSTPRNEPSHTEMIVIRGFDNEEIEVSVEQLELRVMPESTAGFLD